MVRKNKKLLGAFCIVAIVVLILLSCGFGKIVDANDAAPDSVVRADDNFIGHYEIVERVEDADVVNYEICVETTETPTEVPTKGQSKESTQIFSSSEITFDYEYFSGDELMPYGFITPSTASENKSLPLIVWLHGFGEFGKNESHFSNSSLPKILHNWELEGFDAYVLCPHLTGKWYSEYWSGTRTTINLENLINYIIEEYDIDTSKIVLVGHSHGGMGALYMAHALPDYFSKLVVMSGGGIGDKINEIKIPTRGYSENSGDNYLFMSRRFSSVFGEENLIVYEASHSEIPELAFKEDKDGNNHSDMIEWLLS